MSDGKRFFGVLGVLGSIAFASYCLVVYNNDQALTSEPPSCGPGEFMVYNKQKNNTECHPCPDGMYMDLQKHTNRECARCEIATWFLHEVEAEKCTSTKDTVILCTKDHFRQLHGPDVQPYCQRCSKCGKGGKKDLPVTLKPCQDYDDTVCVKYE